MKIKNVVSFMGLSLVAALLMNGCGGVGDNGGANDNDPTPKKTPSVEITSKNAASVSRAGVGVAVLDPDDFTALPGIAIQSVQRVVDASEKTLKTRGVQSGNGNTVDCSKGGTVHYEGDQKSATLSFDRCKIYREGIYSTTITIDGKLSYDFMSVKREHLNSATAEELTLKSADGLDIAIHYFDGEFTYKNEGEEGRKLDSLNVEISADMEVPDKYAKILFLEKGTYGVNHMKYNGRGLAKIEYSIENQGTVKTPQTEGWVEVKTVDTLWGRNYAVGGTQACPTSGQIDVIGKDAGKPVVIVYNPDKSIELKFAGAQVAKYSNCEEMQDPPSSDTKK